MAKVKVKVILRPKVSRPVRHPSGKRDQFFPLHFPVLTITGFFMWGILSDEERYICNLLVQLLLGLARAVTVGSGSRRTHDHILLSHLRLPQPGGPGPRIYIPQEQGGGHWVPFLSPPRTRRATVEVFQPVSTRSY
jgi:hypothetical protein